MRKSPKESSDLFGWELPGSDVITDIARMLADSLTRDVAEVRSIIRETI